MLGQLFHAILVKLITNLSEKSSRIRIPSLLKQHITLFLKFLECIFGKALKYLRVGDQTSGQLGGRKRIFFFALRIYLYIYKTSYKCHGKRDVQMYIT